jgi:3-methyladenine DNA glycosylase Mpg
MEKVFVAQRINSKLQAAEKSIDLAMTEAAELLTTLIEARRELNMSTVVGDKELASLTQALVALESARHSTVELHNGLGKMAKAMRIPVTADGIKPNFVIGAAENTVAMREAS